MTNRSQTGGGSYGPNLQDDEQAKLDEAWRTEILRRVEQVRYGEVRLESWDEVRRAGREALANR